MKRWFSHPTCGQEFSQWLETFHETHGIAEVVEENADPKKGSAGEHVVAPKKVKLLDSSKIMDAVSIVGQKLYDAPIDGTLRLTFRADNELYLVNLGS